MLQKVSIIAGQLDSETIGTQADPVFDHFAIRLGVGDPRDRVGGKVGVFGENMLRAHIFPELH